MWEFSVELMRYWFQQIGYLLVLAHILLFTTQTYVMWNGKWFRGCQLLLDFSKHLIADFYFSDNFKAFDSRVLLLGPFLSSGQQIFASCSISKLQMADFSLLTSFLSSEQHISASQTFFELRIADFYFSDHFKALESRILVFLDYFKAPDTRKDKYKVLNL